MSNNHDIAIHTTSGANNTYDAGTYESYDETSVGIVIQRKPGERLIFPWSNIRLAKITESLESEGI